MIAVALLLTASVPTDLACAALKRDTRQVRHLARQLPEKRAAPLRGLALLLDGRYLEAARELDTDPAFASYRAMALKDGPGGLGRARETLAKHASADTADAQTLFLTALAFWSTGDKERADELLKRAAAKSPTGLDASFAPEPANGLSLAVERAGGAKGDLALARCLLDAGRVSLALSVADAAPDGVDAWRLKMRAWRSIDEREALRFAAKISSEAPKDTTARVVRLERWLADGELARAKKSVADLDPDDAGVARVLARIAIAEEDGRRALGHARRAARLESSSNEAIALIVEALLLSKKPDQAAEFADVLLKRNPADVDPHELIARIQKARGRTRGVDNERMRSEVFREERRARREAIARREAVFAAIRDAEAAGRPTGLAALIDEDPSLSLPVDLALMRLSKSGRARAARDRVLASCGPNLSRFLTRTKPWDRYRRGAGPYFPLSAANPARCARAAPLKARRQRR